MSSGNGYFMVKEKVKTNKVKGMKNCWQCNKLFSKKSNLKRHIQNFHSNGEDCNFDKTDKLVFGKNFMSLDSSNSMLINNEFSCTTCKQTFETKYAVQAHISKDHQGIPPHVCDHCKMEFSHRQGLHRHKQNMHIKKEYNIC